MSEKLLRDGNFIIVKEIIRGTREYLVQLREGENLQDAIEKVQSTALDSEEIDNSFVEEGITGYTTRSLRDADYRDMMVQRAARGITDILTDIPAEHINPKPIIQKTKKPKVVKTGLISASIKILDELDKLE